MHSPQFLKTLSLRRVAEYAEKVGQPLVLDGDDREIFPPLHYPLPTLNKVPDGWTCVDAIVEPSWDALRDVLGEFPEHGFAILGPQFNNGPRETVGRFARN